MAEIGEIKLGREIDKPKSHGKFIYIGCEVCGLARWVSVTKHKPSHTVCRRCSRIGKKLKHRDGSLYRRADGYLAVYVEKEDFYSSMRMATGYVLEHRLIMAQHLGRCLQSWESVHHKNGIKDDNRIENLELVMKGSHTLLHNKGYRDGYQRGLIDGMNTQISALQLQNEELLKHIKYIEWELKRTAVVRNI